MRAGALSVLMLIGCRALDASRPSASSVLQPVPTKASILATCRGTDNEVTVRTPDDGDPPMVVLEEVHLHGYQGAQPTIAVWADGSVIFSQQRGERSVELRTVISPDAAAAIAHDVFEDLEGTPRYFDAGRNASVDGGQLTTITVHAGARWRTAAVHDVYGDEILGTAPSRAGQSDVAGMKLERDPPPSRFAAAYKRLFQAVPQSGDPFAPYEFDAVFFEPQKGIALLPLEVPWPRDLPSPPPELRPERCNPYETDGCAYVVGPAFASAAERFIRAIRPVDHETPAVIANNAKFVVRFDRLYEGERTIDAITTCARGLWHEKGP